MWKATYQTVLLIPVRIFGFLALVVLGSLWLAYVAVDWMSVKVGLPSLKSNPILFGKAAR